MLTVLFLHSTTSHKFKWKWNKCPFLSHKKFFLHFSNTCISIEMKFFHCLLFLYNLYGYFLYNLKNCTIFHEICRTGHYQGLVTLGLPYFLEGHQFWQFPVQEKDSCQKPRWAGKTALHMLCIIKLKSFLKIFIAN